MRNRATNLLDVAIEIVLVCLLAFAPLAFGAVEPWSELVVVAMGAAIAVLLAVRMLLALPAQRPPRLALIVIAIYIGWAVFQLVPLPAPLVRVISPRTVALNTELLSDLGPDALRTMTLSFYRFGTRHDLGVVLLAAVVFFAVITVFADARRTRRLLVWVTLIGSLVALIAMAQNITHATGIYWRFTVRPIASSGPFFNHSHFAQFMNLCIGAALALALVAVQNRQPPLRNLLWIGAGLMVAIGIITVAMSHSRGGILSLLLAGALTVTVATLRRGLRGSASVLLLIGIVGFGGVLYFGFDSVYERLAGHGTTIEARGRAQMVLDALHAARDFPVTGAGLGAHEMIFPLYEKAVYQTVASHVENEYAQSLEETGIIGFACVISFAALVWWRYAQAVRQEDVARSATAIGLGFGLAAVMVHSLSDFGQHLPAIACMTAVICGLIVNLGAKELARFDPTHPKAAPRIGQMLLSIAFAGLLMWIAIGAYRSYRAAQAWTVARTVARALRSNNWTGSDAGFTEMVLKATEAVRLEPDNIEHQRWLGTYRWRAVARQRNPAGKLVLTPQDLRAVERIVDDLNRARAVGPTYGPIYYVVGQLEQLVLDRPIGIDHIRRSYALWPNDQEAALLVAELDADAGDWPAANEKLRRVVMLDSTMFDEAVDVYITTVNQPQRVLDLFEGDWRDLYRSSRVLAEKGRPELATEAKKRAAALLKPLADRPDAPPEIVAQLAEIYMGLGKFDDAADYFDRALKQSYGTVWWRYLRARSLVYGGRKDEARGEIARILQIQPNHEGALRLSKEIDGQ